VNTEQLDIIPARGERAFIVGQTGSGKTAFACWIVKRTPITPFVIFDTKEETKFDRFENSISVSSWEAVLEATTQNENDEPMPDYIVFRPPVEELNDPDALDNYLARFYADFRNAGCFIDEAYTFHKGARAGPGLTGLLTRGRSRGLTTIMCAQRPAWISRFAITETQKQYVFKLVDKRDKKTLSDIIPNFDELPDPPKFGFWYNEIGLDEPLQFDAVTLDSEFETGYYDGGGSPETDDQIEQVEKPRFNWL
jgi:hypothetical protein